MKKIYNIIDRELIFRMNNVQTKNEFGDVGVSSNITIEGASTIFTTEYKIEKVNFVTVNGLNLIEGVHFEVTGDYTISISNNGNPLKKNPSITNTISVSYYNGIKSSRTIKSPPILNFFAISPTEGQTAEIIMDFSISAFDGANIFWSIIKDGESTPLYSGESLSTTNGYSTTNGVTTKLNYFVTETEYNERQGETIPFTLIVVYDLSNDGSRLNEKLIGSAGYDIVYPGEITGSLTVVPSSITTAQTDFTFSVPYMITNIQDYPETFEWTITRSTDNGASFTTVKSGNQASADLIGTYYETISTVAGDNQTISFYLNIKKSSDTTYSMLDNDKIRISVPEIPLVAHAGYLDAALMSYVDPADDVRKKIGSTGNNAEDLAVYNERVPSEIFTKDVTISYLTTEEFISAPVWTDGDTVTAVYFVIELPDNWGPVDFYQTLGLVNDSAFNTISLGNGYTAYLYNAAPSSVSTPSDYYLKSK